MDLVVAGRIQSGLLEIDHMKQAAGVIFLALDTGRCLLQLRNSDKRFKHHWGFWGGMIEPGETVYEAIQRELQEEIGMVPDINKLNPIDVYQSKNGEFMYYSFAAVVEAEFTPTLNSESAGYAWVDIGVWPKPLHEGTRITLNRNRGTEKLHTILGVNRQ